MRFEFLLISRYFDSNAPNQSNMKVVIVALALAAITAAAPVEQEQNPQNSPQIVSSENEQQPGVGYKYGFKSDDGIERDEVGQVKEVPDEENKLHPVIVVRGSYTYIDDQGKQETITYEADEKGFRAFGDSIPKPNSRR